jgi:hypothetical protein
MSNDILKQVYDIVGITPKDKAIKKLLEGK